MFSSVLLFTFLALATLIYSQSLTGDRILIVLPSLNSKKNYSELFKILRDSNYKISLKTNKDKELKLVEFHEKTYDHAIFLCSDCNNVITQSIYFVVEYGAFLNKDIIVDFVKAGGNLVFAFDENISAVNRRIATEFGIKFQPKNSVLVDHTNYLQGDSQNNSDRSTIIAKNISENKYILSRDQNTKTEIYYKGIGHTISRESQLITPILKNSITACSVKVGDNENIKEKSSSDVLEGANLNLISVFQAKNNARVAFLGSTEMISDKFLTLKTSTNAYGNTNLLTDLIKWTFHERGVLKASEISHHKTGESEELSNYQVKDEIEYSVKLSQYVDGKWEAFDADDVQLEVRMIDPYIRTYLERVDLENSDSSLYKKNFILPDKYGVFKFNINYKRHGLSRLELIKVIPIHPLRHDEFPRFLSQAYPYYTSSILLLVGFLIFTAAGIFSSAFSKVVKTKAN
ncbi:hypothetical protein BB558_001852 [Smittium angustum]|uniref:Dolichyl-diphosphooligosaccharide--protein glycosyltransferase subunit WBP1 n=1 Tax=Smittium angustum TaxID=133377 RepID=A0A2U1JAA0_SMIAN|nr:hypothetical protein BB558_001852 [Smittium angustum]